jgi:hypothetical protein
MYWAVAYDGKFLKITNEAQILGLILSKITNDVQILGLILSKNVLGYLLGYFFTNSSGHPAKGQCF